MTPGTVSRISPLRKIGRSASCAAPVVPWLAEVGDAQQAVLPSHDDHVRQPDDLVGDYRWLIGNRVAGGIEVGNGFGADDVRSHKQPAKADGHSVKPASPSAA